MGKGGGGAPQPTSQTVNQTNLPEYARPYFEDLLQRGQAASQVQYQPYQGERVAGFTPLQQQGFEGIQNLNVSPLLQPAAGMTGAAGLGGLFAGQNYAQQATSPGAMQSYMSPYMQNVVDWQKTQAISDYGRQLPGQQAAATRAGAFGGSRQAIVESEAQRNLQNQLAGIQATGTQNAFDQANKNLQFGSQLGLQGLGLAGQMGQQFGQLGQTAFGQQAAAAQAQQSAGAVQQAQEQQKLDQGYEEFMRQQFYPQSQLQFYSSLLRGVPVAPQQTMYSYQAAPSMASQIGGLGLGALGLSRAFGAKDGGEVPGYADGGITGGMDGQPTTLEVSKIKTALLKGADPRSIPPSTALLLALSDPRVEEAIQLRQGAKIQQALDQGRQAPQRPSMLEERMAQLDNAGLAGLEIPEETFAAAGGGIVAFSNGKDVDVDAGLTQEERDRAMAARIAERFGVAGRKLGAAALDVGSAIPRGLAGAANTLIRVPRAAGLPVPFIPVDTSSMTPNMDALRRQEAGLPAALPQAPADQAAQNQRELNRLPPPAPKPDMRGEAPPARPVASASQAIVPSAADAEINKAREIVSGLRTGLPTGEAEARRTREELRKAIPDDLQKRLDSFKSEAAEALKERDKDRWLAVAMGGFAAAAGSSPYALRNFAEGLGLTTKEMMSINKDFRKLQQERNNLMRAEERQARAESLGIEQAAQTARRDIDKRRDAIAGIEANIGMKAADIYGRRENVATETKSAERRTAMLYSDRSGKNALTKRIEELSLKDARGAATPEEKKELTSLVNQLGEISGAKKTKPSSVDVEKLPMINAQIQALVKKGDPQSLYMARLLGERAGIELPDAAGVTGKTASGVPIVNW